jgi:hypothetical protein
MSSSSSVEKRGVFSARKRASRAPMEKFSRPMVTKERTTQSAGKGLASQLISTISLESASKNPLLNMSRRQPGGGSTFAAMASTFKKVVRGRFAILGTNRPCLKAQVSGIAQTSKDISPWSRRPPNLVRRTKLPSSNEASPSLDEQSATMSISRGRSAGLVSRSRRTPPNRNAVQPPRFRLHRPFGRGGEG